MLSLPTHDNQQLHPRENREFFDDKSTSRLLPPAPLRPFLHDDLLTPEAYDQVDSAIQKAKEISRMRQTDLPDDVIEQAVPANYRERFWRTRQAMELFYEQRHMKDELRKIFDLHEHQHPENAMYFFNSVPDLPALDIASALCGRDNDKYDIAREILARTEGHFLDLAVVADDMPHLKTVVVTSGANDERYAIITSKKIIAQDMDTRRQYKMKRRKTYVGSIEALQSIGLAETADGETSVDNVRLAAILQAAPSTPDYLHPVLESVFIERVAVINAHKKRGDAVRAMGYIAGSIHK